MSITSVDKNGIITIHAHCQENTRWVDEIAQSTGASAIHIINMKPGVDCKLCPHKECIVTKR